MTKLTHFIKAWIFLSFMLFFIASAQAQSQNIIIVNNADGLPDSTVVIDVDIQNDLPYMAFQMHLQIPSNFSYVDNSVIINPPHPWTNLTVVYDPEISLLKIIAFSLVAITEWKVVSFTLTTPSEPGDYPLNIDNAIIAGLDGMNILTGTENGINTIINQSLGGSIQLHDASGIVNSTVDIDVEIVVEQSFLSFSYTILLPQGFSYVPISPVVNPPLNPTFLIMPTFYPATSKLVVLGTSTLNQHFPTHFTITHTLSTPSQPGNYFPVLEQVAIGVPNPLIINGTITINQNGAVLPGDANCDNDVNVQDIVSMVSYIMGNNPSPFCFENADVNGDGFINVSDVVGTVNIIMSRRGRN